jgi:hypothetical protein
MHHHCSQTPTHHANQLSCDWPKTLREAVDRVVQRGGDIEALKDATENGNGE